VITLILLAFVEGPVHIEIAIDIKRPEFEDRFAAFEPPPSAGDLHAVFDQVATRTFDDARSDRIPLGQVVGIVEIRGVMGQLGGALIDWLALCRTHTLQGRATA
jgi:hypothetical protein